MGTVASQITSLTVVYSTVYSNADQRKHQSPASLAFMWGIHRSRWIPRTKGQLRGKCFHLMTSSWWPTRFRKISWQCAGQFRGYQTRKFKTGKHQAEAGNSKNSKHTPRFVRMSFDTFYYSTARTNEKSKLIKAENGTMDDLVSYCVFLFEFFSLFCILIEISLNFFLRVHIGSGNGRESDKPLSERNYNVIITSKRRFDAIMTLSLRRVSAGGR